VKSVVINGWAAGHKNKVLRPYQEKNDRKKIIQSAVSALKDDERLCITLFYLNELSLEEIHELTGLSIANIKVLLHRGRKNLYRQLNILLKAEMNNLI